MKFVLVCALLVCVLSVSIQDKLEGPNTITMKATAQAQYPGYTIAWNVCRGDVLCYKVRNACYCDGHIVS